MLVLIGVRNSKRTTYFMKAAEELHIPVRFVDWEESWRRDAVRDYSGAVIKLEPPSYPTADISRMDARLQEYRRMLESLEGRASFVNSPRGILDALDKRKTKRILSAAGVPVTPVFMECVKDAQELYRRMDDERVHSVFIKPVCFSGAAGMIALRRHPKTKKMTAYTSCTVEGTESVGGHRLLNTKRLFCLQGEEAITERIRSLAAYGVMAERWIPKDTCAGESYDLRVVWQFGHRKHVVVRRSAGPFTNLHLNNRAATPESICLSREDLRRIDEVCRAAVEAMPDLRVAGMDVLLEKGSRNPRIIEVNGQGDLLYQDIYGENEIYKEQIRWMQAQDGEA